MRARRLTPADLAAELRGLAIVANALLDAGAAEQLEAEHFGSAPLDAPTLRRHALADLGIRAREIAGELAGNKDQRTARTEARAIVKLIGLRLDAERRAERAAVKGVAR